MRLSQGFWFPLLALSPALLLFTRLAFIGDALAHGVLPGIAVSILAGFSGIIGAAIGAAFMIGGITLITRRSRLSSDTAIGLLFIGIARARCGHSIPL